MKDNRPNILFLLSDQHSFRCMGHVPEAEGGEKVETPNFDRLARQGTVFTDAYCQMPLCTPSRFSLLTGKEVRKSGAWSNGSVLRPELGTIPSVLRDAGYATGLVGKMHLHGKQQFVGFQHRPYGDLTGQSSHQRQPIPNPGGAMDMRARTTTNAGRIQIPESLIQDQVVSDEALALIRELNASEPDKPRFITASFSRPHNPLTAPQRHIDKYWPDKITPPRVPASGDAYDHPMSVGMREGFQADKISHDEMMYARACYFANVSYVDELIGDLLVRLENSGLLDNTIIVYGSDHGEMAGEHGVWWKNGWYEACTRVPFMISTPEQRKGSSAAHKCSTPVGLVDLFPTLLSLAGVKAPDDLDGIDLSASVSGGTEPVSRPICCDSLMPRWGEGTEFRSVRQGRYKYVRFRNTPPLAFDLENDPGEQKNLLKDGNVPEELTELAAFAESSIDFDEAEKERLERDGNLAEEYKTIGGKERTGNLYFLNSGRVVYADSVLYDPKVIAETPEEIFGEDWDKQNK